ncbi:MAG: LamG-like jellyroll fold domain-containing protein [Verrucomicrobiota bacterium]
MKTPMIITLPRGGKAPRFQFARTASKRLLTAGLSLLALPCLLSAQTLVHRYSFVSTANDSVGTANGTIVAPNGGSACTIANGLQLPGGGGPGFSGYVTLPAGILVGNTNITLECWVTQNTGNTWACIWDFNNGQTDRIGLCPINNNDGGHLDVEVNPNNDEVDVNSPLTFPSGVETYVTYTYNDATLVGNLYTNAALVATATFPNNTYSPGSIGGPSGTPNNQFGQDPYNDPQFQGTIYEFRIWNGVVSQRYLVASAVVGPSVVINNLTPTSASLAAGPSVIITGTEQAAVTVQLPQTGAANLTATLDATNWTSSNPNVIAVNSSGLITGVGAGTATVSAKVGGVTATSGTIAVSGPQTLLHRYSFVSNANDSVGTANGTIVPPGNANGTNVTINNGLFLPGGGGYDYSGYVSLPDGILTNTTSLTVECWVTQNALNAWATVWDFGLNGSDNFELCPNPQRGINNLDAAITPPEGEVDTVTGSLFPSGSKQYVSFTFNAFTLTGSIYTNGALGATHVYPDATYIPGTLGGSEGTTNNALGNDIYGDTQFQGTIYELRIWNGAVSPTYVAASAAAGSSVVITNTTLQSLSIALSTTSMIGAGIQQAAVSGNFLQVSGANLSSLATNWLSSNPNVLSVSSNGLITALNGGTATVSATVDGVTATSATITVATTPPDPTQKPANLTLALGDTATFTVQALGGNLTYQWSFGAAPITGATNATLVVTNVAFTSAGTYSVTVANNLGTTNVSATLTISQAILLHRYSFVSNANDSVGGANGTVVAPSASGSPATIANGLSLPGGGGGGFSGYVSLPSGILTNTTSLTVEVWVTQNQPNGWATVWDFANNTSQNFELCPNPLRNINNLDVAIEPNGGEIDTVTGSLFPSGVEEYVTFTFDASTLTGEIYTNGVLAATQVYPHATYIPGAIGGAAGTAVNALGNDIFGDTQFQGTIYEFRIWDGAVSSLYLPLAAAAGPSVVVTDLSPASVDVAVTNSTMTAGQSQPATVTANFAAVSGIPATGLATNWTSSNPAVLTVNSNGLITAVGTGAATVSATVNGVTGTSPTITVPNSPPIITVNPPASETLLVGATLITTVSNIGTAPFTYFWFTNSSTVPFSVSTSPTLTVSDVQLAAGGNTYTAVVSNRFGTATSSALALTVLAPSTYQQALFQYKPLAYWPLDETSGTIAYDVIGAHNGTYIGGYTLGQPGPSQAFFGADSLAALFDGSSGYVDIPEGPFNITAAITVVAWLDPTAANGFDGIVGHGDPSWRLSYDAQSQPGANDGNAPGQNDAGNSVAISIGAWHQVVYTYNGIVGQTNNGALYIDGALAGNNTIIATPAGDNLDVWIGGAPDYGTTRLIAASIADVSVFTYPFTAAQVTGLYNGTFVAGPESISITRTASGVQLDWQAGTLLQAPTLLGPWTTNAAAVSPYTVPATNRSEFFRLLVNP